MQYLMLDLEEEEMAAINRAATEAGFGVHDYARRKLLDQPLTRPKITKPAAPKLETKPAVGVETKDAGQ